MPEESTPDPRSPSDEAVHTAKTAAQAVEDARKAQLDAATEKTRITIREELDDFFRKRTAQGRFIDITRIPFICDDLTGIHTEMITEIITIKGDVGQTKIDVGDMKDLIWKFIWALLTLLGLIIVGLSGWAFTILVHAAH